MKQKLLIMLLILALVVSVGLPVQAASNELTVVINGETQSYNQPPVIIKGSTLVPLRGIFESLGATVSWDGETKMVTAISGNTKISLKIGSVDTTVNGENVKISVPAQIINKSTMVPLRFVSEALGASVGWDGETRTITIEHKQKIKGTNTEITYDEKEFFFKETRDATKITITEDEFNKIKDASMKYIESKARMNVPLPEELEPLKEYDYIHLIRDKDGIYKFLILRIDKGLEDVLSRETAYISYTQATGRVSSAESLSVDYTFSIFPMQTNEVSPDFFYKNKKSRSLALTPFYALISKDVFESKNNNEVVNFEDKELEKMSKRALGKGDSEEITRGDIYNIIEIEIVGPYIRILKKSKGKFINSGDFVTHEILYEDNYKINGQERNDVGNITQMKDISNFPSLHYLKVSFQPNLVDINFTSDLRVVDFSQNNIKDISGIENLKNLTWLNLDNNKVRDISPIKRLMKLRSLYLYNNKIKDISALSNLTELEHLNLSSNKIRDISPLKGSKNLIELYLALNEIKDISVLSNMNNLVWLDLAYNNISDIKAISKLMNLALLYVNDNPIENYSPIKTLPNLQNLEIDGDYDFDDFDLIK